MLFEVTTSSNPKLALLNKMDGQGVLYEITLGRTIDSAIVTHMVGRQSHFDGNAMKVWRCMLCQFFSHMQSQLHVQ